MIQFNKFGKVFLLKRNYVTSRRAVKDFHKGDVFAGAMQEREREQNILKMLTNRDVTPFLVYSIYKTKKGATL